MILKPLLTRRIGVTPELSLFAHQWQRPDSRRAHLPSLLCLHGFTGDGLDFESCLEHVLHRCNAVWSLDLLGHGQSDAPSDDDLYTCAQALCHLTAVIDDLYEPSERLALLGYSMGGRVALHWALTHPERLTGLMLVSASPGITREADRASRLQRDAAMAARITTHGVPPFLTMWQRVPLLRSQRQIAPPALQRMRARRLARHASGLAGSLLGFGPGRMPHAWYDLHTLTLPLLYVCGVLDTKYVAIGQRVSSITPRCELYITGLAGHAPHLECPSDAMVRVASFLKTLEL